MVRFRRLRGRHAPGCADLAARRRRAPRHVGRRARGAVAAATCRARSRRGRSSPRRSSPRSNAQVERLRERLDDAAELSAAGARSVPFRPHAAKSRRAAARPCADAAGAAHLPPRRRCRVSLAIVIERRRRRRLASRPCSRCGDDVTVVKAGDAIGRYVVRVSVDALTRVELVERRRRARFASSDAPADRRPSQRVRCIMCRSSCDVATHHVGANRCIVRNARGKSPRRGSFPHSFPQIL